jgi:protein required for attachment to host cells
MEFKMSNTWILVANASAAALYSFEPSHSKKEKPKLTLIGDFLHPGSRLKDVDITSDRLGEYFSKPGGHGNFAEPTDPHQYEATVFARELSQKLEHGRTSNEYHKLILVAAPHFLGLLRECMGHKVFEGIQIEEVHKDYTKVKPHELADLLNLHN